MKTTVNVKYFVTSCSSLFSPIPKNKNIHHRKNSLHLRKWNVMTLMLKELRKRNIQKSSFQETRIPKKFILFFQKKAFLIFRETETLITILYFRKSLSELEKWNKALFKMFLISQKTELSCYNLTKLLIFHREEMSRPQKQTKNLLRRNFLSPYSSKAQVN